MGISAFNRARRQAEALADAQARDDEQQNKSLNMRLNAEELSIHSREETPDMASPPYPDIGRFLNIPADAYLEREAEAMEEAQMNRTRILTYEAREELQNSHLRDEKTKAIPDYDEAGQDRSQKAMWSLQEEAYAEYHDPRSPADDGRIRAGEPYNERPDVDTTESRAARQKAASTAKDDQPKEDARIIEEGEAKAKETAEQNAAVMLVARTDDPKEAKQKGSSKFIDTPAPSEMTAEPPPPAHLSQDDMPDPVAAEGEGNTEQAPQQAPGEPETKTEQQPAQPASEPSPEPETSPDPEPDDKPDEKPEGKATRGRPRKNSKED